MEINGPVTKKTKAIIWCHITWLHVTDEKKVAQGMQIVSQAHTTGEAGLWSQIIFFYILVLLLNNFDFQKGANYSKRSKWFNLFLKWVLINPIFTHKG